MKNRYWLAGYLCTCESLLPAPSPSAIASYIALVRTSWHWHHQARASSASPARVSIMHGVHAHAAARCVIGHIFRIFIFILFFIPHLV